MKLGFQVISCDFLQVFSGNLVGFETVGSNIVAASTLSLPTDQVQGLRVDSYIPSAVRTDYSAVLSWLQPADQPTQYYLAVSTNDGVTYIPLLDPATGGILIVPGYFPVGANGRFSFTASNLLAGEQYLFVVRSGNDEGFYPNSSGSAADPTQSSPVLVVPVDPPARPRLISWAQAGPDYNSMVSLTWIPPQAGGPPDSYSVLVLPCGTGQSPPTTPVCPADGSGFSYVYNSSGVPILFTGLSAIVSGLSEGTWYRFSVEAGNLAGLGAASDPTDPLLTASLPQPPSNLEFSSVSAAAGITLIWDGTTGAVQYSIVRVPALPGGAAIVTGSSTSFTDSAAPFGAAISYTVYSGDASGAFEAVGTSITLPGPASSFRVTFAGPGNISFAWEPDTGSTVFRVLFSRSGADSVWRSAAPDVVGANATTVSGLPIGVTFLFKVVSRGPATPFEPTGSLPVAAAGSPPPPPPESVVVTFTTATEVHLSWEPPQCSSSTPPTCTAPTRYLVAAAAQNQNQYVMPVEVQSLAATITGLNYSIPLQFRVSNR